jgi:hypothetical protein
MKQLTIFLSNNLTVKMTHGTYFARVYDLTANRYISSVDTVCMTMLSSGFSTSFASQR